MQSNNRIFTRDDVVFAGPLLNIIFETVRNTLHQTAPNSILAQTELQET